jgi:hypothetical protein
MCFTLSTSSLVRAPDFRSMEVTRMRVFSPLPALGTRSGVSSKSTSSSLTMPSIRPFQDSSAIHPRTGATGGQVDWGGGGGRGSWGSCTGQHTQRRWPRLCRPSHPRRPPSTPTADRATSIKMKTPCNGGQRQQGGVPRTHGHATLTARGRTQHHASVLFAMKRLHSWASVGKVPRRWPTTRHSHSSNGTVGSKAWLAF